MIGGCLACVSAGEVSLDFSEPGAAEWYFENYVLRGNPLFSDEEARRAGKMPNGMTAPDGFWNMSVKERADFTKLASWMNFTNPSITQEELLGAGGKSAAGGKNGPPPSYYGSFSNCLNIVSS
jgi:hypothetical protein